MLASVVDYVREHPEELLTLVRQHLELTLVSVVVAAVIAWPAATAATRMPRLARLLTGVASVTQTVPSIAVLGLVIPVLGIGFAPALFALVLRALMPLFLNTYVGLKTVDPAMLEAARGLGMRSWQVLLYVEGPTVLPAALAGLRTAAVQNVAIATLAAFIGAGGLGNLILQGLAMLDAGRLLAGAIPTAALAVLLEVTLGWAQTAVTPLGLRVSGARHPTA